MLLYIILFLFIIIVSLHHLLNNNNRVRQVRKIPGPKPKFFFGHALDISLNPVELFQFSRKMAKEFDGIYSLSAFNIISINIYNPEDVEIVTSNVKHNEKSYVYSFMSSWLREGLLVSKGTKWHHRRKILTPAFHFQVLKKYFRAFETNNKLLVETLIKSDGEAIDIVPILSDYTLNTICETIMGVKLNEDVNSTYRSYHKYKEAIYNVGQVLVYRLTNMFLLSNTIFNLTRSKRIYSKNLSTIHNFTASVIEKRKQMLENKTTDVTKECYDSEYNYAKNKKVCMLDLLLSLEEEGLINREGVHEEVDTFMFEGHDTTSVAITFCLLALANEESVQDKIVNELDEIFGEDTRAATMEDLGSMRYMELCIKESLRLYPPVPFIGRTLKEPVVLKTIMGVKLNEDVNSTYRSYHKYKEAIYNVGQVLVYRLTNMFLLSNTIFNLTRSKRIYSKNLSTIHNFTASVIEKRKQMLENKTTDVTKECYDSEYNYAKNKKVCMLDLLLSLEEEGLINREGVHEEVDTFMFEGHDTTSVAITFCLLALANEESVQDKIVNELDEIFGEDTRAATMEDLGSMRYMELCIKESLRLYPPVPFIGRTLKEPVVLSNYQVPANSMCFIYIYELHRNEAIYKDAEKFDPDRFLPENSVGRHNYAYIPFSAGPRNCIGQKFAMLEMKSALSSIFRKFKLMPVTKPSDVIIKSDIVLRTSGPIYVKFVPRN